MAPQRRPAPARGRLPGWLLPVLLAAGLGGCGEGEAGYFPLDEGMSWGYRISMNSQGVGRRTYRSYVSNLAPEAVADVTATPRVVHDGRVYYDAEGPEGVRRVAFRSPGSEVAVAEPGHYVLKYPLKPGATWRVASRTQLLRRQVISRASVDILPLLVDLDLTYSVEALDAVVRVPAGVFRDCVQVRGFGKVVYDTDSRLGVVTIEVETREWFAPGVGLVRVERAERSFPENPFSGELVKELEVFDDGSWLG